MLGFAYLATRLGPPAFGLAFTALSLCAALGVGQGLGVTPAGPVVERNATPPSAKGPNVVLITLDTVRADHLSIYGYDRPSTPQIEALSASSIVFETAHATASYTLASHASLFTGLLPSAHGAHAVPFDTPASDPSEGPLADADYPLPEAVPTLAQDLRRLGYRTEGIAANPSYLAPWSGLARGFDRYDCDDAGRVYGHVPVLLPLSLRLLPELYVRLQPGYRRRAAEITDAAIARVASGRSPFFLFLNYMDAHEPFQSPAPWDRRFLPQGAPAPGLSQCRRIRRNMDAAERACVIAQYDGALAYMDAEVGRLVRWLDQEHLLEDSLVIVTSDHGELFGEHGLVGHDNGLLEGVLRVPLLVKLPGAGESGRVLQPVSLRDVPGMIQRIREGSRRIEDIVPKRPGAEPVVIAEQWFRRWQKAKDPARIDTPALRAVFALSLKVIEMADGRREVYELSSDPGEDHDLAKERPERFADLAPQLAALGPVGGSRVREKAQLNPEVLRRLMSLGYIQ
jgi:arylsulfatase A-like enzyme